MHRERDRAWRGTSATSIGRRWRGLARCVWLAGLAACDSITSAVEPAGPQAERISDLTWWQTGLGAAVYLVVMGTLLFAVWRSRRRDEIASDAVADRRMRRGVTAAVAVTVVILLGLVALNFATGRALAHFAEPGALSIKVVGHQWWWSVEYEDPLPARRVLTANEIHLPVGRRVRVAVESRDVIHSFWAPNLHGKVDLIPGYTNVTYLQADRPGVYFGRCAEFCGMQHARMDLRIIAVPPDSFAGWYERQLQPAVAPTDSMQQRGQRIFLTRKCALCHTVRGTPAGSRVGPDLTHIASRQTLAAGTLPNTRGHLAGWVLDPQRIKPGVKMPPNQLSPSELDALLAYLQSLK